jgi:hypothetical protein
VLVFFAVDTLRNAPQFCAQYGEIAPGSRSPGAISSRRPLRSDGTAQRRWVVTAGCPGCGTRPGPLQAQTPQPAKTRTRLFGGLSAPWPDRHPPALAQAENHGRASSSGPAAAAEPTIAYVRTRPIPGTALSPGLERDRSQAAADRNGKANAPGQLKKAKKAAPGQVKKAEKTQRESNGRGRAVASDLPVLGGPPAHANGKEKTKKAKAND